ncbi:MAG: hypothetical protein HC897_15695, partial [Thermoanaerobaculia bacterium]|nr:hypothetical protein [Thermoanaerobaculia bacterium]
RASRLPSSRIASERIWAGVATWGADAAALVDAGAAWRLADELHPTS